jgi:addiction module RelB/DinJ family antitoxin
MNTTSLHIQIEPAIKQQAQKTADELGLSLSAVTKALLKQFIRTKQLSVGLNEIPNARTVQELKRSEEDIKAGRTISFKNMKEAISYIDSLIADDKQKPTGKD